MFTAEVKKVLEDAKKLADEMQSKYITLEHVVYSLIKESPVAKEEFARKGKNIEEYLKNVKSYIEENSGKRKPGEHAINTPYYDNFMNYMTELSENSKHDITIAHMFSAIIFYDSSAAVYMLSEFDIDEVELLRHMTHGFDAEDEEKDIFSTLEDMKNPTPEEDKGGNENEASSKNSGVNMPQSLSIILGAPIGFSGALGRVGDKTSEKKGDAWKRFVFDVTEQVKDSNEPFIGRQEEIERTCHILCRKFKNNPIHIGEPGVGKTAITYGLAKKILAGDVPNKLKNNHVYELDLAGMMAGTEYRGEFEARLKALLNGLEKETNCILYIDEIHTLVGAGETSNSKLGASNIIKKYLTKGTIKFIGATTRDEYTKYFEKDKALSRRFMVVDIEEPSRDDAIRILEGLKGYYEEFHNVTYTDEALSAAVDLSIRHIHDRFLPDKAIDLIDEAGAYINSHDMEDREVTETLIGEIIAKNCKIPSNVVQKDELASLRTLDKKLSEEVFGQDNAIKAVSMAVKMSRAGLADDEKPTASFLFVGPTGTGKTLLARTLAKELDCELVRFDMSEYQEAHTVSKLIGSPAGYVGYEEEGLLTQAVRNNPNCVLLFDEIEKAHKKVYDIMLQIMDYGMLTDNKGKKISFRNAIIIFTSNAGAAQAEKGAIGFGNSVPSNKQKTMEKAVKDTFSPEFRNRLSGIVTFNYLTEDMARLIVKNELKKLDKKLLRKSIVVEYSQNVYDYILERGFNVDMGAREIGRVIEQDIKPIFMNEILFHTGKTTALRKYRMDYNEDEGLFLKAIEKSSKLKKVKEKVKA